MQDQVEKLPGCKALASFCENDDSAKEFTKELRSILEVTATTGRYWHDWAQLRVLLCFRLTQVLQEFHKLQHPENGSPLIGPPLPGCEPFPDMMERLIQSLDSFTDGAPFTSQRLCEILLSPKDTYNNLDKLALALEKLLLVQSTYPPSTDPYPVQPLAGAVPTESLAADQKAVKLEGDTVNAAQDSIESFKEMPAIDEEMVDVERVLDEQVPVYMAGNSNSDVLHEPSASEIRQAPGTNSEMLHDSPVDLPQIPGTNSKMVHDSSGTETTQAPSTASEMLLERAGTYTVSTAPTNTQMLHDSNGADLPQVSGPNFEMLHDSPVMELPQPVGTSSEMIHDSTSVELSNNAETAQAPSTASEMLLETTGSYTGPASATNTEMLHDSTGADLPQIPSTNFDMLQDSPIVELPQEAGTNLEMTHDTTSLEFSSAPGSNTEMLHESTVVELPPAPVSEAVASNTEMLHDATVVDLLSAPEESIESIDVKAPGLEEGACNQIDSSGVHSPQASQGSVDMKQSCPEESVNSHVPITDEDRSEDVSMGIVS